MTFLLTAKSNMQINKNFCHYFTKFVINVTKLKIFRKTIEKG